MNEPLSGILPSRLNQMEGNMLHPMAYSSSNGNNDIQSLAQACTSAYQVVMTTHDWNIIFIFILLNEVWMNSR